jgi:hypothetical protein
MSGRASGTHTLGQNLGPTCQTWWHGTHRSGQDFGFTCRVGQKTPTCQFGSSAPHVMVGSFNKSICGFLPAMGPTC